MTTPVTVAKFRADLPEFADTSVYPDSILGFWLTFASQMTDEGRWGELAEVGQVMFSAHHVVLERQAMMTAAVGGVPGLEVGIVNNKSVDKVSVGYDTQGGQELDAGHWNQTIYGRRYIHLARMIGGGPVQIGIGCAPVGSSAGAWAGPWPWNFPNPS